jgi:hypothetical protein
MAEAEYTGESADLSASVVKPPKTQLAIAAAAALVSLLAFVPSTRAAHFAGYLLGTFVTILAVALFRRSDASRSSSPLYSPVSWMSRAAIAILTLGILCGVGHIYFLAQRVAG